ncbi:uncharacterized protein LOC121385399 isoform X1 [Gigantopelta aegis]|uniref:uncharacterized protein LOC121385399 isoform X1 n=1 Tax=Gigantopelta aegis TaxID=1735272 RepID=UPI001B88B3D1|nr:uncharacterized protein LOC121385399 isoform X1 [Gigantopelta aegis]
MMMNLVIVLISLTLFQSCLAGGIFDFTTTGLDGSEYEEFRQSDNSFVVLKNNAEPTRVIEDANKGVWILFFYNNQDSCFVLKMTEEQRMEVNRTNGKKIFSSEMLENFDVQPADPVDPEIQGQCGADRKVMNLIPTEDEDSMDEEGDPIVKRACRRRIRCTIKLYRICCRSRTRSCRFGRILIKPRKCILFRIIHCKPVCI